MRRALTVALVAGLLVTGWGCTSSPRHSLVDERQAAALREDLYEQAVRLYVDRYTRLLAVSYAIRTAGAELCAEQVGPILGIAAWRSNPLFGRPFFDALDRLYGVWAASVAVVAVQPGSPADRAGIRIGDRLLRVGGNEIDTDIDVFDRANAAGTDPISITVFRDEAEVTLDVARLAACHHEALIEIGDLMLTDRARGDHFYVTSSFIRFAKTDDELALVVAHEIAHRLTGMRVVQGPQVEIRADRLGLYLAARAGYDIAIAPEFWDRVAVEQPWSLSDDVEHYGWSRVPPHGYMPSRAAAVRRVVAEIEEKNERGLPLLPGDD